MEESLFKESHSFEKRLEEAKKIINKYPDRIPVIVEVAKSSGFFRSENGDLKIDKKKYLVPKDITLGQFNHIVRKRIKLAEHEALITFAGEKCLPMISVPMGSIYAEHRDEDQFLYLTISKENTFGSF
jgi:GABA(A) receptor-associated protein